MRIGLKLLRELFWSGKHVLLNQIIMEWDFEPKDIVTGEIKYSLEDFWRDLQGELAYNMEGFTKKKVKFASKLVYRIVYLKAIGKSDADVLKILSKYSIDEKFLGRTVEGNSNNIRVLESIMMRMILVNLESVECVISDSLVLKMVNFQLDQFHKKHCL